jgi:hypothetical protein
MARSSFKKLLRARIQEEREHRGVSGAALLDERSEPAPNPRHMVAFSSDDLPALRSGRRPGHSPPAAAGKPAPAAAKPAAATAPAKPAAAPAAPASPAPATRPPGEGGGS